MLDEVTALRYVSPLRSGGSLPGVTEADDLGTYVVKFHGAAQGRKALVAEVVAGELGRRLGLRVPDLVRVRFDPAVASRGPGGLDEEVLDLLRASEGLNLGMDLLPGARDFEPSEPGRLALDPLEAGRVVWFDALTGNVDRTWRSPNLMVWHGDLWLIDHGAALVFHHRWPRSAAEFEAAAAKAYPMGDHALGGFRPDVAAADAELAPRVTRALVDEVLGLVPDEWLADEPGFSSPGELRDTYAGHLLARARSSGLWLPSGFATPDELRVADAERAAARRAARPDWLKHL